MSRHYPLSLAVTLAALVSGCSSTSSETTSTQAQTEVKNAQERVHDTLENAPFYKNQLASEPLLPSDLSKPYIHCPATRPQSAEYKSSQQVKYDQAGWESRVAADWNYFNASADDGRILVIDALNSDSGPTYRYLANANTQDQLFEPWSTSKIMAFTGAVSKARQQGVGARALAGGTVPVADLITSINTYEPFGKADGNSNAIATYFANVSGRDYLTSLFQDEWLNLANDKVALRGAYYIKVFDPDSDQWHSQHNRNTATMSRLDNNSDDPGYRSYRCETCGLTGNKPMTTLAQAEWLKRLAMHDSDPATQHPHLESEDIATLFYGIGHSDSDHQYGGMLLGISRMLSTALAKAIDPQSTDVKSTLDQATDGEWRIFQKIGWGPSGTRGRSEVVMLAQVCLPEYQGGHSFTLSAQASVDGDEEMNVNAAGKKLQRLLVHSMAQKLNP